MRSTEYPPGDVSWPMSTVHAVLGDSVEYVVAGSHPITSAFVARTVRPALARMIGDRHGRLRVFPGDLSVDERFDATANVTRFVGRWRPIADAELCGGGSCDGDVVPVLNVWGVLHVAVPELVGATPGPMSVRPVTLSFVVAGWRESSRRWVFRQVTHELARLPRVAP